MKITSQAAVAEYEEIKTQLETLMGNITKEEWVDLISTAREYSEGGFTAAEAQELGKKLVKAVNSK